MRIARRSRDRARRCALVQEGAVLISRCAWHPHYCGYPRLGGVASWRGWTVRFTDGICVKCLERFRAEHRRFLERQPPPTPGLVTAVPSREVA